MTRARSDKPRPPRGLRRAILRAVGDGHRTFESVCAHPAVSRIMNGIVSAEMSSLLDSGSLRYKYGETLGGWRLADYRKARR